MKDFIEKIKREGKLVIGTFLFIFFGSTALYYKGFIEKGAIIDMGRDLDNPCFIGDTGTGGFDQKRVAQYVVQNCKDVFFLGDIIYPSGLKNSSDPQFYEKFYNHYPGTNKYVVLGNHDSYNNDNDNWLFFDKKYDDVYYPNYFYALKFNETCVLAFESSVYGILGKGKFEKAQNRFVKAFTERSECKFKIAIAHHPYWSSGKHGDAKYQLKPFYEKYLLGKVDVVITGHDHNLSFEGCSKGTCHYTSGSGAKLRDCKKERVYCESVLGFIKLGSNNIFQFFKVP